MAGGSSSLPSWDAVQGPHPAPKEQAQHPDSVFPPERKDGSLMLKVAKVMSTPSSPFLIPLEAELSPFPEHFRADFMICLC